MRLDSLRPGDSPRTTVNAEHIERIAHSTTRVPPILVHRGSMRIIDGHHRFQAAVRLGREEIDVLFLDGDADTAFLHAVTENTAHGLPLSLGERKAAAFRVLATHRGLSDRAIARVTGLSAKTIAQMRSAAEAPSSNTEMRRGLDGRSRPVTAAAGRRRAAELMIRMPTAPLREIAKAAGVSVGTAHDVRKRLLHGEDPVPRRRSAVGPAADAHAGPLGGAEAGAAARVAVAAGPAAARDTATNTATGDDERADLGMLLRRLVADPSLRQTDTGRQLLRLLHAHTTAGIDWPAMADMLPPHCAETVIRVARECARGWELLVRTLELRATDPS
ncbi:ParB/RepB/Spo0J family partition protein [Actinomadura nitritigenes]|uniref:ParB/RepB/Spo0J family partition protein n=1 Tax=Actinomadura nitritigenes TaxID=134602 RepID=UPI003D8E65D0